MRNAFGEVFKLSSYGESHGPEMGGVINGCPAGISLDFNKIQEKLSLRKPGQSKLTTSRQEADEVIWVSGLRDGVTTGQPIAFKVMNTNQRSKDYKKSNDLYRPSHADYTYEEKYGLRVEAGGGRSSARETLNWVVAGAVAEQVIQQMSALKVVAQVTQVGSLKAAADKLIWEQEAVYNNDLRATDLTFRKNAEALILEVKKDGDSVGGVIQVKVFEVPVGLGEPVFDKLSARLGHMMLSLNAVKAFEIGGGFDMCSAKGSEVNDAFKSSPDGVQTVTNFSGGIQGGISNGMEIDFKVGFKPTATILKAQNTVNKSGVEEVIKMEGRHDPCVLPRAVVIVESLAYMVLLDFIMLKRLNRI